MRLVTAESSGTTRAWTWPVLIAVLAVTASLSGIGNQYAQDDIPIIWKNPVIHDLGELWRVFVEPYWPRPFSRSLYRPFASVTFSLQWLVGGGDPLAFRVTSYLVYALVCVAVFYLASLRLPLIVAGMAAALFAVHPVHVESVAVAVNQSELWVGGLSCLAVLFYVRKRAGGMPLSTRDQLLLAGLYLVACLFKENALMIPGFLIAAEALLVPHGGSIRTRIAHGRRLLLILALVAVGFYWVRTQVLSGNLLGTFVAEALTGLSMGERALAMLAVVPTWYRLLLWPAHLQADYSPGEIVAQTSWGLDHTVGLLLLATTVLTAVLTWRRAPMITLGIVWSAIALFPVHNVLVPTGIVVAERTLFLPSIGVVLALGGVGALLVQRAQHRARVMLGVAGFALILLGLFRSATRHPVWSDQFGLWYKTANEDAPRSFRAHDFLAEAYFQAGQERMAEQEYELAMQFAPPSITGPRMKYADKLRQRGWCFPAVIQYKKVVEVHANHGAARAALAACLIDLGRYREAQYHARLGIAMGWQRSAFRQALLTADSAEGVSAPPGTVRINVASSDSVKVYMRIGERK
jgi:hypothetical protein